MFCTGAWLSEYLRNRLNRKLLIGMGISAGLCFMQFFVIDALFIYLGGQAYLWRTPVMIGRTVYFIGFIFLGIIMNMSLSRKNVDADDVEDVVYPFRYSTFAQPLSVHDGRLLKDFLSAIVCFGLYLTMKRLPENIQFYYSTSEALRLAIRSIAIIPWIATLIFVYQVCCSDPVRIFISRFSKLSVYLSSMLPAAILVMIPMQHIGTIFWWVDLIRYPIYLILLSMLIRFLIQLCICLFSKSFGWKYILI